MKKLFYYLLGLFDDNEETYLFFPLCIGAALLMVAGYFPNIIGNKIVAEIFEFWVIEIAFGIIGIQGLIYFRKKNDPIYFSNYRKIGNVIRFFMGSRFFLDCFTWFTKSPIEII